MSADVDTHGGRCRILCLLLLLEMSEEIIGAAGKRSFCLAKGRSGDRDGGEDEREHSERRPDI